MSSIHAGHQSEPTRSFSCTGEWWVPGTDERINGTLRFSPAGGGAVLDLLGAFQPNPSTQYASPRVILGMTPEKGPVTICDPGLAVTNRHSIGAHRMDRERWIATSVFTGANLPEGWKTRFSEARLHTARMDDWTNLPRPSYVEDENSRQLTLSVDIPSPVVVPVAGGEIALEWWETRQYGFSAAVSVSAFLCFRPSEPLDFESIWVNTFNPLFLMMCFVTGAKDQIAGIRLFRSDDDGTPLWDEDIEVYVQRWGDTQAGQGNRQSFLIRYEDVAPHLSQFVPAWLTMYERTHLSMIEFFSDRLTPGFYAEDRFIRISRSMEMWHRDIIGGELMESREWKVIVNQAKSALSDPEHRRILAERLAHGNEPNLRRRLCEITELAGEPMKDEIEQHPNFLSFVVTSRNNLTHGSKSPEPDRLISATYILELTFTCAILRHLGIPAQEVDDHIRRSELGMWLFWGRGNPWGPFDAGN